MVGGDDIETLAKESCWVEEDYCAFQSFDVII